MDPKFQKPVNFNCGACRTLNQCVPNGSQCSVKCYVCGNVNEIKFKLSTQNPSPSPSSSQSPPQSPQSSKEPNSPKPTYYEILGIPTHASPEDIKRSYYKMARLNHPDKNLTDPQAEEKFQLISEAYQILSNPQLRDRYDLGGNESVKPENGFTEPKNLFNQLFGSSKFDNFIGEAFMLLSFGDNVSILERKRVLHERLTKLSDYLGQRLDTYHDNPKEFEIEAKKDAEELKKEKYGINILHTIAEIYEKKATQHSGGLSGFFTGLSTKTHNTKGTFSALSSMKKLEATQQKLETEENSAQKAELEKKLVNEGLEVLWQVGKLEIEETVQKVCDVVLNPQLTQPTQKRRIQAIQVLANVFKQTI